MHCGRNELTASSSLHTDAVEKVPGMAAPRNNRIIEADFLNRSCAFDTRLELILLGDPPQNLFSTASTRFGHEAPLFVAMHATGPVEACYTQSVILGLRVIAHAATRVHYSPG